MNEERTIDQLSIEELRESFKDLMARYSSLTMDCQALKIENEQIKMAMIGMGMTTTGLKAIRARLLSEYIVSMPPLKRRRGRPDNYKEIILTAELYRAYTIARENGVKLGLKPWLRQAIIEECKAQHISTVTRQKEINMHVQALATRVSRYKNNLEK